MSRFQNPSSPVGLDLIYLLYRPILFLRPWALFPFRYLFFCRYLGTVFSGQRPALLARPCCYPQVHQQKRTLLYAFLLNHTPRSTLHYLSPTELKTSLRSCPGIRMSTRLPVWIIQHFKPQRRVEPAAQHRTSVPLIRSTVKYKALMQARYALSVTQRRG